MNNTDKINLKSLNKINKLSGEKLFFMEEKRKLNLFRISQQTPIQSILHLKRNWNIEEENKKDFDAIEERYGWF